MGFPQAVRLRARDAVDIERGPRGRGHHVGTHTLSRISLPHLHFYSVDRFLSRCVLDDIGRADRRSVRVGAAQKRKRINAASGL